MTTFQHFGLYFIPEHVQNARKNREREPFAAAWAYLHEHFVQPGSLAAIQWNGLRYRFDDDVQVGEQAVIDLQNGVGLDLGRMNDFEAIESVMLLAQGFELMRGHAAWSAEASTAWLERFAELVSAFAPDDPEDMNGLTLIERVWVGLLNVTTGIVLEDEARVETGATIYRQVIDREIRPEGYLPAAVEGNDGGTLSRQMWAVAGLVLMAEAASHVGLDLWGYTSRGISVVTAASYLIYYYYYPDQWRWGTLVEADVKELFRTQAGFLEIVNRRARPKDIKLLLDELRPFYSPISGGLPTLSHAPAARRGLFGS